MLGCRFAPVIPVISPLAYAIGGVSVGEPKDEMLRIMAHTPHRLPAHKPRYLMGVGTPEDLVDGVACGVDMFDCVMPTRNARNGHLFTRFGDLKIRNAKPDIVVSNLAGAQITNFMKQRATLTQLAADLLLAQPGRRPALFLLAGCQEPNSALFVTASSIGIDVDTKPPTASIAYHRVEGFIGPTDQNGDLPAAVASLQTGGTVFDKLTVKLLDRRTLKARVIGTETAREAGADEVLHTLCAHLVARLRGDPPLPTEPRE